MNFFNNKKTGEFLSYFLFGLLIYFPLFLHLEQLPIRIWDEARLANNAFEMYQNGDFLIPHFMGEPDMWNSKPPFMIWCQTFFMHLFGPGELAVRLPSALAGAATCIFMVLFSKKTLGDHWPGLLAGLILVTSNGFIDIHVTRTGDYDAMMIFLSIIYTFCFYQYLQKGALKYLHIAFVGIALVVLTKSVQGLIFLPALFFFLLYKRKTLELFQQKWFYIDLALCLVVSLGYYFLREAYNPGYMEAVWDQELGGRYFETKREHHHSFSFYFDLLVHQKFQNWILLVPGGILLGLTFPDKRFRELSFYLILLGITYFMVISMAKTKLVWYSAPLIPILSFLTAIFLYWIFQFLRSWEPIKKRLYSINFLPYLFLFLLIQPAYGDILDKVYHPEDEENEDGSYKIVYLLREKAYHPERAHWKADGVCHKGYFAHLRFYTLQMDEFELMNWNELKKGDRVVTHQKEVERYIEKKYRYSDLYWDEEEKTMKKEKLPKGEFFPLIPEIYRLKIYQIHGPS